MSYVELKALEPKARKEYACEWCGEAITVGLKHFYRSYIWDGDFNSGRMHMECKTAMHRTPSDELEEGWTPGSNKRGEVASWE